MPIPLEAPEVLDREFLTIRCKLIDLAAALDRIDRAKGSAANDPRLGQIGESLKVLSGEGPGRAEKLQMLFSLPYQPDWRND
jgi:hypothetical protein